MYDSKSEDGIEGLSTWQLLNMAFKKVETESQSLVHVVDQEISSGRTSQLEMVKQNKVNKIRSLIAYFESLLEPNDEFSAQMAGLYDWYNQNLNKLLSRDLSAEERMAAGGNVVEQAGGFLKIWSAMPNDK